MFLGNDLVHWSGAAAREKARHSWRTQRFIDRVLHEREHSVLDRLGTIRERLVAVPLPRVQILWALWAAKEAAFKAAVKAVPGLPFAPRSIRIEFLPSFRDYSGPDVADPWPLAQPSTARDGSRSLACGLAHVRDHVFEVLWEHHEEFVHALALGPLDTERTRPAPHVFSDHWKSVAREATSIPMDRASGAVRHIALQLLAISDAVGTEANAGDNPNMRTLRIVRDLLSNGRLGPPVFYDGDAREDFDLSLTHDGPWGAAAILRRAGRWKREAPA